MVMDLTRKVWLGESQETLAAQCSEKRTQKGVRELEGKLLPHAVWAYKQAVDKNILVHGTL